MEVLTLKTFKAVVDEGGIKGAADKLHTVQSNITNRIKNSKTNWIRSCLA